MKWCPLLPIATLYASGIIAAEYLPIPFQDWLLISLSFASCAWAFRRFRQSLVFALLPLCGASLLATRTQIISPIDLRRILGSEPRLAALKGVLLETPSYTRYEQNGRTQINTSVRLRALELTMNEAAPQPVEGRVLVTIPSLVSADFFGGQIATVEGVIGLPKAALAKGLFDYRKYLATQGTYYQLQSRGTNDWKLIPSIAALRPWADRFLQWGQRVTGLGLPEEDQELHLLWAMTLGWRPGLNFDSSAPFIRTGTMHIFAISGLHVALITAILVQLFRFFQIPRAACGLAIIPLIWFYTGATGWQPSAIRSTIMSSIVVLGWSLKRPSNLLNSLLASAIIILIWQPEQLFQASFQLSFFVVLSMALLLEDRNPSASRLAGGKLRGLLGHHPLSPLKPGWKPIAFVRWWRGDELLPPQLEPTWLRGWRHVSEFLKISVRTSVAAWIGSLPLIMYYFSIITPISLFANLLVVPISSLALTCNLASLCTGEWFSSATTLFNYAAWFFMLCMDKVSALFASWRPGYFYTRLPSAAVIVSYFAFLVLAAGCRSRPRLRYVSFGALAVSLCLYLWPAFQIRDALCLTILPTGGGTVLIEDHPAGRQLLVDAADQRGAKMIVSPFLHARGINSLDSLVLTHASTRHVSGTESLVTDTPPRNVISSHQRFRSRAYNTALRTIETNHISHLMLGDADAIGRWRVLHPGNDSSTVPADDCPLVLAGEYSGLRLLLLSELGRKGQASLLERHGGELKTDILIAGMPARDEPLSPALLKAAAPKLIVLCTSEYPASARGNRKLRERLQTFGVPVFYSDEAKAVTIIARPNQFHVEAMDGESFDWRAGELPKRQTFAKNSSSAPAPSGRESSAIDPSE